MQSSLYTEFTWSRNHVAASGAKKVYLLVEYHNTVATTSKDIVHSRRIAEQVQLHLQLGTGVRLNAWYGCRAEVLNELNYSIWLGSLLEGEAKHMVLEFDCAPHPSGNHPIVTVLCTYKDATHNQIILPSQTISLQFSNHTSVFVKKMDRRVEKCLKLLQNPFVLEKALRAFEGGNLKRGEEMIRRRADEMLTQAIRLEDIDYLREAEILYALSRTFLSTYLVDRLANV